METKKLKDALLTLKEWAEKKKTEHELPCDKSHEYRIGYVQAMNDLLNCLK